MEYYVYEKDTNSITLKREQEDHAKFYAFVIDDALAYMHGENVIFRDLEPENILIDRARYPVIVDFGCAKFSSVDETFTVDGAPTYLAPEMIKRLGHGVRVDHWVLGIVIYEMIAGKHPFHHDGLLQCFLYEAICNEDFDPVPSNISMEAFHLIDQLLGKDPMQRIGMLTGKENDIISHDWFGSLDIAKLRCKEIEAPWIPIIQ